MNIRARCPPPPTHHPPTTTPIYISLLTSWPFSKLAWSGLAWPSLVWPDLAWYIRRHRHCCCCCHLHHRRLYHPEDEVEPDFCVGARVRARPSSFASRFVYHIHLYLSFAGRRQRRWPRRSGWQWPNGPNGPNGPNSNGHHIPK